MTREDNMHVFIVRSGHDGSELTLKRPADMGMDETIDTLKLMLKFLTWGDDLIKEMVRSEDE